MARGRISFKSPAVRVAAISPAIFRAIAEAADLWGSRGLALVVTSLNDGEHRPGSRHYSGDAVDLRSHNVPPELRAQLAIDLAARLGATFRVLHEAVGTPNEHFHVELRPARV
ncbi:MAG TPA: hypothetical protein P5144_11865 [Thermoanaerobaculia bacterium]|jgi:hypothetical protein|nr:hypothetical protein [Thermoanaerobaculia bacterium]